MDKNGYLCVNVCFQFVSVDEDSERIHVGENIVYRLMIFFSRPLEREEKLTTQLYWYCLTEADRRKKKTFLIVIMLQGGGIFEQQE